MNNEIKHKIIEKGDTKIKYFISPWDLEAFGFRVVILEEFNAGQYGKDVLKEFYTWCGQNSVGQCNIRMRQDNIKEMVLLQDAGFNFIDTSLRVDVNLEKFIVNPQLLRANLSIATDEDRDAAAQIAYHVFSGERYHRDHNLDNHLANKRFKLWVQNCRDPEKYILLISKEGKQVTSFFLSRIEGKSLLNLSLAGTDPEYRGLGYFLYYESLSKLKEMGFKQAYTFFSAFNTKVLNIYANLDMKFGPSSVVFHKWFHNKK